MLDIETFKVKVKAQQALTADEQAALLSELQHYRKVTAYLAEQTAISLDTLPETAPVLQLIRYQRVCTRTADLLAENVLSNHYSTLFKPLQDRLLSAVNSSYTTTLAQQQFAM